MEANNVIEYRPSDFMYGFVMVGGKTADRECVYAKDAYNRYCRKDPRLQDQLHRETFLSSFTFDNEFKDYLKKNNSVQGYDGPSFSDFLWFDIDSGDDLAEAQRQTKELINTLMWYGYDRESIVIYFSGSKGFCVGITTASFGGKPSLKYHEMLKHVALGVVKQCKVLYDTDITIDTSIYRKVQPLRAPNTRHFKSYLYKVKLSVGELFSWSIPEIMTFAKNNFEFDAYPKREMKLQMCSLWDKAEKAMQDELIPEEPNEALDLTPNDVKTNDVGSISPPTNKNVDLLKQSTTASPQKLNTKDHKDINESTRCFILNSARPGEKRLEQIFKASANLAEIGCSAGSVYAILRRPAEATGKPLSDVRSQLKKGIAYGMKQYEQLKGGSQNE